MLCICIPDTHPNVCIYSICIASPYLYHIGLVYAYTVYVPSCVTIVPTDLYQKCTPSSPSSICSLYLHRPAPVHMCAMCVRVLHSRGIDVSNLHGLHVCHGIGVGQHLDRTLKCIHVLRHACLHLGIQGQGRRDGAYC